MLVILYAVVILLTALSGAVIAASPLPWTYWRAHPLDAVALARGENPRPRRLHHPKAAPLSAMAQLGRQLFNDPRLSGSGKLSCAGCHDPTSGYAGNAAGAVALGGPNMHTAGFRTVPSLRYLYRQPMFSIGPDSSGDNDQVATLAQEAAQAKGQPRALKTAGQTRSAAANRVPQGGLFWDGRVNTLQQQASGPLFNPAEMAAQSPAQVAAVLQANYATPFTQLFGAQVFTDPGQAVSEAMFAISRYQMEDPDFHPFTSKYDAWLAGKARLTPAELRGYLAFNDPQRGNCAACHLDQPTRDGLPPLFTDFQYEALGVPRNPKIPANADPQYYDLGLCGPYRTDLRDQPQYCGMFLTPTLRNVALRHHFFHNGVFTSLHQVLDWYVNRDLHPARFYPKDVHGQVEKYDDLPVRYRANVDTADAPFDRKPGDRPALTPGDIDDVIAFLKTLTDGYGGKPSADRQTLARSGP